MLICAVALFSSCSRWQTAENNAANTAQPFVAEEIKSAVPFQTKEPENYQFDLIVTTGTIENKTFTARNGGDYRVDYTLGNKRLTAIRTAEGRSFLILDAAKIYAETSPGEAATAQEPDDWTNFLTNERLNTKADARFTDIGAENGLSRYLVNFDDGKSAETIVFVDENLKLPVKQEFYSISGDERTLVYKIEMRNLRLQTYADTFTVPADYRRVTLAELRAAIKKEGGDERR